jgi:hypothetical protein
VSWIGKSLATILMYVEDEDGLFVLASMEGFMCGSFV